VALACWVALAIGARAHAEDAPGPSTGRVSWDDDAGDAGRWVQARWPGIVAEVQERLGIAPSLEGAEVLVVRGPERLRQVARVAAPTWAGGVTVGGSRIVVRVDGEQGQRLRLASTLRHEAVHLLWARQSGPGARRLPRWFEEGLAEEVGGEPSVLAGARLELALGLGELIDFRNLSTTWPEDAFQADLAYQQGRRWVSLLVAREGWGAVRRVLEQVLAAPGPQPPEQVLDAALWSVTRHGLSDWHADWRSAIERQRPGWWLWFLTDLGGLLIMVTAVICGLAYFGLRRRRRRAIEALPDEPPFEAGAPPP
jgi:hypothetical protein